MKNPKTAAVLLAAAVIVGSGTAWADSKSDRRSNDVVFHDTAMRGGVPDYVEVYKQEGNGDKNYLYTVTQVISPAGQFCTVFTFASEASGFGSCVGREAVEFPERFRPLDPSQFRER